MKDEEKKADATQRRKRELSLYDDYGYALGLADYFKRVYYSTEYPSGLKKSFTNPFLPYDYKRIKFDRTIKQDTPESKMDVDMEGSALFKPQAKPKRGKMKGGALYSQKPHTKWYGNLSNTQDKFTPFGTKLIQAEQFQNDHIVSLFHACGTKDRNFPIRKVNSNFATVLRDMMNGKAPDFKLMNALSDDDKVYLNKILRKTKQHGYYSVPMPEKDDDTKHQERLEWCLGQIRAGNNSPDIVKELKTKLLWFRNNKLMPRNQINTILYELNDLGY